MNASPIPFRGGHAPLREARTEYARYQDATVLESLGRTRVAIVLSLGDERAANLFPVLAGLGVTTIDRAWDADAVGIVAAIRPELTVVVCDPTKTAGAEMISMVAAESNGGLLIVDIGKTADGTVAALDLGADATVNVRADAKVIRATVNALLRRLGPPVSPGPAVSARSEPIRIGDMMIDNDIFEVRVAGEPIRLTHTEFRILAYLADHAGKVRSQSQIMASIHDYAFTELEARKTVKVYVRRIRRKLAACSDQSVEIINSRAFGYRLAANEVRTDAVRASA